MKYHDNNVSFSFRAGYELVAGSYTVNDLDITSGQDPDGKNTKGMVKTLSRKGELSFRVGRKGSKGVAKWFNSRFSASENTFDHTAGDLNFAFTGKLQLTLRGGALQGRQETFTFENIGLAQGHAGASNNWWFAGKKGVNVGDHGVRIEGKNAGGATVSFIFSRGGNDVSTVSVSPDSLVDTGDWMGALDDSTRLDQIMMPGSHDAGMSELHHCNPPLVADAYTQTQGENIGKQLEDGARYFDIRVDYDHKQLVTYHRSGKYGCNGQKLVGVLDQAKDFLHRHPREIVILKFSHVRSDSGHDAADTKKRIDELLNSYDGALYKNGSRDTNLAKLTIGAMRGKMILAFDYKEHIDPAAGRFRYKDGAAAQANANLTVYDQYSNTANYGDMKKDQLKKWADHAAWGGGYLFLLSWTLTSTGGPLTGSIRDLAAKANGELPGVLYDQIVNKKAKRPNIVYIDFVNHTTTQSIILHNWA